jgi:uncharacterized protein
MKIVNNSKKTILTSDAMDARSFFDKSIGLLDPKKPRSLVLHTRFGIHTLGMKHAIDVLILNKAGNVVKRKSNLKPNNVFLWHPKYSRVIELPAGTLTKTNTELNDNVIISH